MSVSADSIRDQQRIIWDQFAAGWKKWDAELLGWHGPFGDALIEEARLRPGASVLDVAAGTGEPGLTAAALVPDGSVVLTDISAGMLRVAEVKASARGLQNVRFEVCDAAALPFGGRILRRRVLPLRLYVLPRMSPALTGDGPDGQARGADNGCRVGPGRGKPVGQPDPGHAGPPHGTAAAARRGHPGCSGMPRPG